MTLIEKLKHEHDDRELTCQDLFEDGHFDDKKTELLIQQTGVMAGLQIAIDIVKQHSEWISVSERLPSDWSVVLCYGVPFEWDKTSKPNSNIFCAVYVAEYDRWSVGYSAFGDTSTQKVTHWQPLPQPPSEAQDD